MDYGLNHTMTIEYFRYHFRRKVVSVSTTGAQAIRLPDDAVLKARCEELQKRNNWPASLSGEPIHHLVFSTDCFYPFEADDVSQFALQHQCPMDRNKTEFVSADTIADYLRSGRKEDLLTLFVSALTARQQVLMLSSTPAPAATVPVNGYEDHKTTLQVRDCGPVKRVLPCPGGIVVVTEKEILLTSPRLNTLTRITDRSMIRCTSAADCNGTLLAVGTRNGFIRLIDVETHRILNLTYPVEQDDFYAKTCTAIRITEKEVVAGFQDGRLRCWRKDDATGIWYRTDMTLRHEREVTGLALLNGAVPVSSGSDGKIIIHFPDSPLMIHNRLNRAKENQENEVNPLILSVSPEGMICYGNGEGQVVAGVLKDTRHECLVLDKGDEQRTVTTLACNNRYIASGYHDGFVKVFERESGALVFSSDYQKKPITKLLFYRDSRHDLLVSMSADRTIAIRHCCVSKNTFSLCNTLTGQSMFSDFFIHQEEGQLFAADQKGAVVSVSLGSVIGKET